MYKPYLVSDWIRWIGCTKFLDGSEVKEVVACLPGGGQTVLPAWKGAKTFRQYGLQSDAVQGEGVCLASQLQGGVDDEVTWSLWCVTGRKKKES